MMLEREQKKLALVGTSGTGKTALFEALREHFKNNPKIAFVEEAARIFFQENVVEERFSAETQGQIQTMVIISEQAAHESSATIIICDRSAIDAVAYTRSHGDKKGAEELFKRVEFWLPTYHQFILLDPADIPYQTDGIRKEDEFFRQKVHETFLSLFKELRIPFQLLRGTLEERLAKILQILDLPDTLGTN